MPKRELTPPLRKRAIREQFARVPAWQRPILKEHANDLTEEF